MRPPKMAGNQDLQYIHFIQECFDQVRLIRDLNRISYLNVSICKVKISKPIIILVKPEEEEKMFYSSLKLH